MVKVPEVTLNEESNGDLEFDNDFQSYLKVNLIF